jgi:hypothetical protein
MMTNQLQVGGQQIAEEEATWPKIHQSSLLRFPINVLSTQHSHTAGLVNLVHNLSSTHTGTWQPIYMACCPPLKTLKTSWNPIFKQI